MRKRAHIQFDHLKNLNQNCSLEMAIAELIWNAIDAQANEISVNFKYVGSSNEINSIEISDNGHGIQYGDAEKLFCCIGHSEETHKKSTSELRTMHGSKGVGRLYAFRLGKAVTWKINSSENGNINSYDITTSSEKIDEVEISELNGSINGQNTGVVIIISELNDESQSLKSRELQSELTGFFSLYYCSLIQKGSDSLEIKVNGISIFENLKEEDLEKFELQDIKDNVNIYKLSLNIIKFNKLQVGKLYLCDGKGFPLGNTRLGIQSNECYFTAFLNSEYFSKRQIENGEKINYIDEKIQESIELAREKIRSIIRERGLESSDAIIQKWKSEGIYPISDVSGFSTKKLKEKQLFDSLALQVNSVHPKFLDGDKESMELQLRLILNAIEFNPSQLSDSLYQVLKLDNNSQSFLSSFLKSTSLATLIQGTRKITDRIKLLEGLKIILYDEEIKPQLMERSQLHKVIANNAWIFGEEFELVSSERSLTQVLKKHIELLEDEICIDEPVLRPDGKRGIIDLMLSRPIPYPDREGREHLIVELKRPSKILDEEARLQIENYANTVGKDQRFRSTKTNWVFWVISNEMSESVRDYATQADRPFGLIFNKAIPNIKIWVKTWGQLLNECENRMSFIRGSLNYCPDRDTIVSYLEEKYKEYLPDLSSLRKG